MTCAQILEMSSTEWIAYFGSKVKASGADASSVPQASAVYGKCYDARTDSLAKSLAKTGKGPSRAARADFVEFETALKNFTAKAVVAVPPNAESHKQLLAALYQKQFRYEFYEQYEPKVAKPVSNTKQTEEGAKSSAPLKSSAKSVSAASNSSAASSTVDDTDEMTREKNMFGELLGALPDDTLHELHAAFGEVIGLHALDNAMRLAVYRYAVFLLEPSTSKASYPPPF
jgi:hypothetical protein